MAAELSKRSAMEESWKVQLRAADDKAGAAGHVALDLQRQCEAAAATIGRLIGENSDLMGKINLQANKMSGENAAAAVGSQFRPCIPTGACDLSQQEIDRRNNSETGNGVRSCGCQCTCW